MMFLQFNRSKDGMIMPSSLLSCPQTRLNSSRPTDHVSTWENTAKMIRAVSLKKT